MTAERPCVRADSLLTLHYRLSGPAGVVIDTFGGPPATLSLGTGELAPAVEARLIGMREGEQAAFDLPAGAAFGERQPQMQQWVARRLLDALGDPAEDYEVGDVVRFPGPAGDGVVAGTVRARRADGALLVDFNHPLAGQPVRFEVSLIGVL